MSYPHLWNQIKKAYNGNDKNAFILGSSKETMEGIVNKYCLLNHSGKSIREELDNAVEEGLMVKGTNPKTNYTTPQ